MCCSACCSVVASECVAVCVAASASLVISREKLSKETNVWSMAYVVGYREGSQPLNVFQCVLQYVAVCVAVCCSVLQCMLQCVVEGVRSMAYAFGYIEAVDRLIRA